MSVSMTVQHNRCIRFPNQQYISDNLLIRMITAQYTNNHSACFNPYLSKHKGGFDRQ